MKNQFSTLSKDSLRIGITKHYEEDLSQKILKIGTIYKNQWKCDITDGSVANGVRQQIIFSFVLDKRSGKKIFCETETLHYKKGNQSGLKTMTFFFNR